MSEVPYVLDMQRMPFYPFLLWLCNLNPIIILFIQFIVQTATAWYIYRILNNYTRYAPYIGLAYWIMPNSILFSSLILTECVFVFFMVAGLYYLQQKKWIWGNVFILLSVFTRPNSILILGFISILGLVYLWRNKASKRVLIHFLIGISISFLSIFAWLYRNYSISKEWKLSILSDNTLIHGRLGGILCYQKKLPYTDNNLVCQSEAYLIKQKVVPLKKYYSDIHRQETEIYTASCHTLTYQYITQNFLDYLLFQIDCGLSLFKGMGYKSWLNITENKSLSIFFAGLQILYTLVCVRVLFRSIFCIKNIKFIHLIVLLSVIAMLILSLLPYADTRYRFPIDSLIFLLYGSWKRAEVQSK